ncbi:hypothetical protein [Bacillus sp. FJAT-45350]|uniref:hypothetical protein n=1 Tax=Bacillus sp. FJAT-45350 TaxID=2011014 RepID=UPI000BB8CAB9|nr:hypothetical protein [Bacillus sp. FJAT-45350]
MILKNSRLYFVGLACLVGFLVSFAQMPVHAEESIVKEECNCSSGHDLSYTSEIIDIHMTMYYQLLAEKYAPELVAEWNEIQKERDMLEKKITELEKTGALLHGKKVGEDWYKSHAELQTNFAKAIKEYDEKEIKKMIPKLFDQHKELNKLYKKRIQMAK